MLHWMDYAIILTYLVGCVFLGFYLERRASKGIDSYFLGDRKIPWWALGASGMASNVDISGTMVLVALVYALGTRGFFIEIRGGIVLIVAFFMVFMGKWMRRANVMTGAEWMEFRFGKGTEGRIARLISAITNLVVTIWIISYFAMGGGKFFGMLTGIEDQTATLIMMGITMTYTVASGFYGAVWTDVFQGVMILVAVVYVVAVAMGMPPLPEQFMVSVPGKTGGTFETIVANFSEWSTILPSWEANLPGQYSAFNTFGILVFFYLVKTSLEGFGGAGGYMGQRYFAAKSDREAGLLSLFWLLLLSFRWPLIAGFAVLGIHIGINSGVPIADPELVLPTVIAEYCPPGVKGLIIACFMAAAMSTFTSLINSGAAYWVKDIYQAFLKPGASEKSLMRHSRVSSVIIVGLGVIFAFPFINVNDIWGWITMAFGTGLFIPAVVRWYWWRFNGYGFAAGTGLGALSAIVYKMGLRYELFSVPAELGEYMNFAVPAISALTGCVLGTILFPATDKAVLENFYKRTRPFGFWGPVRATLPVEQQQAIATESRRDLISVFFAVPWQLVLFMLGTMFVMKQWFNVGVLAVVFGLISVGLYHVWFKHLSDSERT